MRNYAEENCCGAPTSLSKGFGNILFAILKIMCPMRGLIFKCENFHLQK
jgi:hypothetical protein